jgi:hypothetical protein
MNQYLLAYRHASCRKIVQLLCVVVAITGAQSAFADVAVSTTAKCFKVFDALLFTHKPDLRKEGLLRAAVPGPDNWQPSTRALGQVPDDQSIRAGLRAAGAADILVLDKEQWPVQLNEFKTLLAGVRRVGFNGPIGYYAIVPIRDSTRALDPVDSKPYRAWQSANDLLQPIADEVDAIFPSLYTFSDDEDGWTRYAIANLSEARRMARGKPVYAFIWPQYDEQNKVLGLKLIPGKFWALQLQTVAQYADGAVIWGGYKVTWDEQAEWWQATQQFLQSRPSTCSVPSAPGEFHVDH